MKLPGRKIRGSGSTCKSNNTSHGKEGGAGSLDRMEKNCKMRRVEEEAMIVEETSMTMIISDRHHRLLGSLFACDTTSRNQIIFFYCHKEIKGYTHTKCQYPEKKQPLEKEGRSWGKRSKHGFIHHLKLRAGRRGRDKETGRGRDRETGWQKEKALTRDISSWYSTKTKRSSQAPFQGFSDFSLDKIPSFTSHSRRL